MTDPQEWSYLGEVAEEMLKRICTLDTFEKESISSYPYALCMEYSPTFTINLGHKLFQSFAATTLL